MFDWLKYDDQVKEEFAKQSAQLDRFLSEYIQLNGKMRDLKIFDEPDPVTLEKIKDMEIPSKGRDSLEVGNELVEDVFKKAMLVQHPRFFSFVPGSISPYSLAGSILTDIFNLHGGSYLEAPGACLIEEKIVRWMGALAGYPEDTCGGVFLSGGSLSNMSAMVAARDAKLGPDEFTKARVYFSYQTHGSNEKGLRILGFRPNQMVKIDVDDDFRIKTDDLEKAIQKDIEDGYKPFAVIGNLGTTNTGAVDPLDKIADLAEKYDLWFHIDGAYGASILLSGLYRGLAKGIERSDSFSWDTHKWLMQVYSCGTLIVRDKKNLLHSFVEHREYLQDVVSDEHSDAWDLGPEMTRPHRAIKLWYTLQATGTDLLEELIDYSCYNAILIEKELQKDPNMEIISRPSCGCITFRFHPKGFSEEKLDDLNHRISGEINRTGYAYIVTTTLREHVVLRMCTLNCNTTKDDIVSTVALLSRIAAGLIQ